MLNLKNVKIGVKLTLIKNEKFFGSGLSHLLHLIEKNGSIKKACEEMDMAYSKAWKILKRVEKELNVKILDTTTGGAKGGLSKLTDEGKELLLLYDKMNEEMEEAAEKIKNKYIK